MLFLHILLLATVLNAVVVLGRCSWKLTLYPAVWWLGLVVWDLVWLWPTCFLQTVLCMKVSTACKGKFYQCECSVATRLSSASELVLLSMVTCINPAEGLSFMNECSAQYVWRQKVFMQPWPHYHTSWVFLFYDMYNMSWCLFSGLHLPQ